MADLNEKIEEFTNTTDTTNEFDASDIEKNKAMAILSYLGILVLVPIFGAKDSKYARFHANQGLTLLIVYVAAVFVFSILGSLPFVGWIIRLLNRLLGLAYAAFLILGVVNAAQGKAKELPLIGNIKILK